MQVGYCKDEFKKVESRIVESEIVEYTRHMKFAKRLKGYKAVACLEVEFKKVKIPL